LQTEVVTGKPINGRACELPAAVTLRVGRRQVRAAVGRRGVGVQLMDEGEPGVHVFLIPRAVFFVAAGAELVGLLFGSRAASPSASASHETPRALAID
jgi:hypothetical protein